jgi:cupin fold WbuC family metalloprotein
MEKYYSKITPNKLLHIVNRIDSESSNTRNEIIPEDNFLQCANLKLKKGTTFRPHKHITKERHYLEQIAQESWVVIRGSVLCYFYDIDDSLLNVTILNPGDASFTLYGGHNYLILEDDTIVYEYKTGPYEGQVYDKTFIDGK